ncbi:MAG: PD-(D/E)XK nuclease family protein [Patescibacteria group bacterium]
MPRATAPFDPTSDRPYRLSRSKIELFTQCPQCFYLDRRLKIGRPEGPSFTLNNAVDALLKKEFDVHRARGSRHPLHEAYGLDLVPLPHEKMDEWRDALRRGITFLHAPTNFLVTGGIDDVWVTPDGELVIVDYKATSTQKVITLDESYRSAYKRQMDIYQWLFRQNGFRVSKTGYFVYCNGLTDREAFDAKLEFDIQLIPYEGDDSWIEDALLRARACLEAPQPPKPRKDCAFCLYRAKVAQALG